MTQFSRRVFVIGGSAAAAVSADRYQQCLALHVTDDGRFAVVVHERMTQLWSLKRSSASAGSSGTRPRPRKTESGSSVSSSSMFPPPPSSPPPPQLPELVVQHRGVHQSRLGGPGGRLWLWTETENASCVRCHDLRANQELDPFFAVEGSTHDGESPLIKELVSGRRVVAAVCADGSARVWLGVAAARAGARAEILLTGGHRAAARCLALEDRGGGGRDTGRRLITGAADGECRLWWLPQPPATPGAPVDRFRCLAVAHGHRAPVVLVQVRGPRLFAAAEDGSLRVWTVIPGVSQAELLLCVEMRRDMSTLSMRAAGHHLVLWSSQASSVLVLDSSTGSAVAQLGGHAGGVAALCLAREDDDDGGGGGGGNDDWDRDRPVAAAFGDGVDSDDDAAAAGPHDDSFFDENSTSSNSLRVITGSVDGIVRRWAPLGRSTDGAQPGQQPTAPELLAVMKGHTGRVVDVAVSGGGLRAGDRRRGADARTSNLRFASPLLCYSVGVDGTLREWAAADAGEMNSTNSLRGASLRSVSPPISPRHQQRPSSPEQRAPRLGKSPPRKQSAPAKPASSGGLLSSWRSKSSGGQQQQQQQQQQPKQQSESKSMSSLGRPYDDSVSFAGSVGPSVSPRAAAKLDHLDLSARGLQKLSFSKKDLNAMDLVSLEVGGNQLSKLPTAVLKRMARLHSLAAPDNLLAGKLSGLPKCLPCLQILVLDRNRLTQLPSDFAKALPRLAVLSLSGNFLRSLPACLLQTTTLRDLDLSYNRLDQLPSALVDNFRRLESLAVEGNQLWSLPDNIGGLSPQHLLSFTAHGNQLTVLPGSLLRLESHKHLKTLTLHQNPLTIGELPLPPGDPIPLLQRLRQFYDPQRNQIGDFRQRDIIPLTASASSPRSPRAPQASSSSPPPQRPASPLTMDRQRGPPVISAAAAAASHRDSVSSSSSSFQPPPPPDVDVDDDEFLNDGMDEAQDLAVMAALGRPQSPPFSVSSNEPPPPPPPEEEDGDDDDDDNDDDDLNKDQQHQQFMMDGLDEEPDDESTDDGDDESTMDDDDDDDDNDEPPPPPPPAEFTLQPQRTEASRPPPKPPLRTGNTLRGGGGATAPKKPPPSHQPAYIPLKAAAETARALRASGTAAASPMLRPRVIYSRIPDLKSMETNDFDPTRQSVYRNAPPSQSPASRPQQQQQQQRTSRRAAGAAPRLAKTVMVAVQDYKARRPGELSFSKGEHIVVLLDGTDPASAGSLASQQQQQQQQQQQWLTGRVVGDSRRTGLFSPRLCRPAQPNQSVSASSAVNKNTNTRQYERVPAGPSSSGDGDRDDVVVAAFDYVAGESKELGFVAGQRIRVLRRPQSDGWWFGCIVSNERRRGFFPSTFVLTAAAAAQAARARAAALQTAEQEKDRLMALGLKAESDRQEREAAAAAAATAGPGGGSGGGVGFGTGTGTGAGVGAPPRKPVMRASSASTAGPGKLAPKALHVIAMHPYKAEDPVELSFNRLDIIKVVKKNLDTGWWLGINTSGNGAKGWFPSSFTKEK